MRKEITSQDIIMGKDFVDLEGIEGKATHIEIDPEIPEKMQVYGDFIDCDTNTTYHEIYVEMGEYHIEENESYPVRFPTSEELEEYTAGDLLKTGWTYFEIA